MTRARPTRSRPSSRASGPGGTLAWSGLRSPAALAAIAVAILLAAEVARLTAADELAETRPGAARLLAPEFAPVILSTAMAGVGRAASHGQLPDQLVMAQLESLSRAAPLNPQPYLVAAAIAQKQGDLKRAEQLLVEARRLSPRAPAARYLLADLLFRDGRISEGLGELATLTRLLRGSALELVPALAQFAKTPGAARELNKVLASNPRLKGPLLAALAADPDNEALILELAGPMARVPAGNLPEWQRRLLEGMVSRKSYEQAYSLWRRLSGIGAGPRPLLYNGEFRVLRAPPPFNWRFASKGAGLTEPGNGSMRVIYYGRENVTLASQLLLLPPGRYRFTAPAAGSPVAGALTWAVGCHPSGPAIAQQDLGSNRPLIFQVPAECPAQLLELRGALQDMPQESDVRIGAARIERVGP